MKIKTECHWPPIPIRSFDWSAVDDDTYNGPGSPCGWGATEAEAIADFKEQWAFKLDIRKPHMSDWTDEELRLYSEFTGQIAEEIK